MEKTTYIVQQGSSKTLKVSHSTMWYVVKETRCNGELIDTTAIADYPEREKAQTICNRLLAELRQS